MAASSSSSAAASDADASHFCPRPSRAQPHFNDMASGTVDDEVIVLVQNILWDVERKEQEDRSKGQQSGSSGDSSSESDEPDDALTKLLTPVPKHRIASTGPPLTQSRSQASDQDDDLLVVRSNRTLAGAGPAGDCATPVPNQNKPQQQQQSVVRCLFKTPIKPETPLSHKIRPPLSGQNRSLFPESMAGPSATGQKENVSPFGSVISRTGVSDQRNSSSSSGYFVNIASTPIAGPSRGHSFSPVTGAAVSPVVPRVRVPPEVRFPVRSGGAGVRVSGLLRSECVRPLHPYLNAADLKLQLERENEVRMRQRRRDQKRKRAEQVARFRKYEMELPVEQEIQSLAMAANDDDDGDGDDGDLEVDSDQEQEQ